MDSNAHSTLWGCTKDNQRGRALEEYIIGIGSDLLNKGSIPTFTNQRSATIIDITFTDPLISDNCLNWRIHTTPSLSDHVAIRVDLYMATTPPPKLRIWKTADWPLFRSLLQTLPQIPTLWSEDTLESQCHLLHQTISSALDQACPLKTMSPKHKLPWWNYSLDKTRRAAHRLHTNYQKRPTELNKHNYNTARRAHQRLCRKTKRESWKNFVSSSNTQKSAALLSRVVQKKINVNSIGQIKLPNGILSSTTKSALETLVDEHFPGNSEIGPPPTTIPTSSFTTHLLDY